MADWWTTLWIVVAFFVGKLSTRVPRKPDFIIGNPTYLHRWYLTPKSARLPGAYLHKMVGSDGAAEFHDHPVHNISIPLWPGYIEWTYSAMPAHGASEPMVIKRRRWPLVPIFRAAEMSHRIELIDDRASWSLWLRSPKVRDWGFWCVAHVRFPFSRTTRWRHWREYTDGPNGEVIGRGCSE